MKLLMRRVLFPHDAVVLAYILGLSVLVAVRASRIEPWWMFLAYHGLAVLLIVLVGWGHRSYSARGWRFLKYWVPVVLVAGAFREIHYLAPFVHSYHDGANDWLLRRVDLAVFGDVGGFLRRLEWGPATDVLMVCYWSYLAMPIVLGIVLYTRGEFDRMRECLTVLMLGWFLSFAGYWIVPARGPHFFEGHVPAGWLIGDWLHRQILHVEWDMPDAFPSGHVLTTTLVLMLARRHHPALFRVFLPPGVGVILATVYMRYHYLADVVASFLLVAPVWYGGLALFRRWEQAAASPETVKQGEAQNPVT